MTRQLSIVDGRFVLGMERRLAHAPVRVWAALTEPARLADWFPDRIRIELRAGGTVTYTAGEPRRRHRSRPAAPDRLHLGHRPPALRAAPRRRGQPDRTRLRWPGAGSVTRSTEAELLEHDLDDGGRVRWELRPGTGHGARLVLLCTGPPGTGRDRTLAEAPGRVAELLAALP